MKTGSSGVPKTILTRETDSSDTFTGDLSTLVKNENEIAVFYPAAAITATSSDTLTQTLNLSGQDGTLAGITNYDYSWALCKASMNETTGSSACEMTSLVTIGKFQFTANGDSPLNNITRITVTATAGNLYSSAVMKLKDGEFSSTQTGNITIKNKTGISGPLTSPSSLPKHNCISPLLPPPVKCMRQLLRQPSNWRKAKYTKRRHSLALFYLLPR
ncbi:hypothetical protein NXY07_02950 [Phocaeicola dorei]|nr:hypothetical protein [Phocaeicola dorei]